MGNGWFGVKRERSGRSGRAAGGRVVCADLPVRRSLPARRDEGRGEVDAPDRVRDAATPEGFALSLGGGRGGAAGWVVRAAHHPRQLVQLPYRPVACVTTMGR